MTLSMRVDVSEGGLGVTMFAQVTIMHCIPDQLDEFAVLYHERVVAVAQAQMGYRGVYLLLDRGRGKIVDLSLWDCEEDAAAHKRSASHLIQMTGLAAYLVTTLAHEGFEVSVDA